MMTTDMWRAGGHQAVAYYLNWLVLDFWCDGFNVSVSPAHLLAVFVVRPDIYLRAGSSDRKSVLATGCLWAVGEQKGHHE